MKVLFKICFICVYIIEKFGASGQLSSELSNSPSSEPQVVQDIISSNDKTTNNYLKDPDKYINSNQETDTEEFYQEIKHPPDPKSDQIAEIKRYKRQENTEDYIPIVEAEDNDYDSQNIKNLAMEAEDNNKEYSEENYESPQARDFKVKKEKENEIFNKTNITDLNLQQNMTAIKDYNLQNIKKINPSERSPMGKNSKIDQRNRKINRKLSQKQAVFTVDDDNNDKEDNTSSNDPIIQLDVSTIKIQPEEYEDYSEDIIKNPIKSNGKHRSILEPKLQIKHDYMKMDEEYSRINSPTLITNKTEVLVNESSLNTETEEQLLTDFKDVENVSVEYKDNITSDVKEIHKNFKPKYKINANKNHNQLRTTKIEVNNKQTAKESKKIIKENPIQIKDFTSNAPILGENDTKFKDHQKIKPKLIYPAQGSTNYSGTYVAVSTVPSKETPSNSLMETTKIKLNSPSEEIQKSFKGLTENFFHKKANNSKAFKPTPTLFTLPEVETEKDTLKLRGTRLSTTESTNFLPTENVSESLDETGELSDQLPITKSQINVFDSRPRVTDNIKYQQDKETLNHSVLEKPVVQHSNDNISKVFTTNITILPEEDSRDKEITMKMTSQKIKKSRIPKYDEAVTELAPELSKQNEIKESNSNSNSSNQRYKFKTDFQEDDGILSYPVLEKVLIQNLNTIKNIGTTEAVTPTIAELASRADSQETNTTPKIIKERYQSSIFKDVENNKERDLSRQNISQRHVGHTGDQKLNETDKTYLTNILKENQITRSQEIPKKIFKINQFPLFREMPTSPDTNKNKKHKKTSPFKDIKDNLHVHVERLSGEKHIRNATRLRKSDRKIGSFLPKQSYRFLGNTSKINEISRNTRKNNHLPSRIFYERNNSEHDINKLKQAHDIQTRIDDTAVMSTIKEDAAYLQNKLKELEKNINSHSFTVNDIQNDISFLLSDIKEIRNKFKKEEKLFESTIDLQKLESEKLRKQVEHLEADVKSIEEKVKVYNKDESYAEVQLNQVVESVNKITDIQISLDDLIHRLDKLENHTKFVLNFEPRNDDISKLGEQKQAQKQTQQKKEEQEENQQPQQQQQILNLNNKVDILSKKTDNEIILNDNLKTNVMSMKGEFETSINEIKEDISSMHRSLEDLAKQFETLKLEQVDDQGQDNWKHLMDKVDKTHNHKEAILIKNQKHLEARLEKIIKNLKIGDQLKNTENKDIGKKKDLRSLNLKKAVSEPNKLHLIKKHRHRKNVVAVFDDRIRFFKIFEIYLLPHLRQMGRHNHD